MSIDRIGKGSGVAGPASAAGAGAASSKQVFEASGTKGAAEVSKVSLADRVRGGEIDMKTYLDARVEQATRHLEGRLSTPDIERVRGMLKTQMAEDPAVQEMIQAATGRMPPSAEGDG